MMNKMTAEEAVEILKYERDNDIFVATEYREKLHEALTKAIKALEQQPCEDCISRQAVIDFIIDNYGVGFNSLTNGIRDYLPSVTPERPKGRWIFCYGNRGKDNVEKCSCCKSYWKEAVIYRYDTREYLRMRLNYCPNCGAEMEGEEDANNN